MIFISVAVRRVTRSVHLAQFEESLRIAQQLFEANPNSAQAARDVSVSLNKLGDFYLSRGQAGDAERGAGAVRGVPANRSAAVRGEPELGPGGARRQCVAEQAG